MLDVLLNTLMMIVVEWYWYLISGLNTNLYFTVVYNVTVLSYTDTLENVSFMVNIPSLGDIFCHGQPIISPLIKLHRLFLPRQRWPHMRYINLLLAIFPALLCQNASNGHEISIYHAKAILIMLYTITMSLVGLVELHRHDIHEVVEAQWRHLVT